MTVVSSAFSVTSCLIWIRTAGGGGGGKNCWVIVGGLTI